MTTCANDSCCFMNVLIEWIRATQLAPAEPPPPPPAEEDEEEPADQPRLMMNVADVADELQISHRTVWKLIGEGTLPSVKVRGRRLVVRDALIAYLHGEPWPRPV